MRVVKKRLISLGAVVLIALFAGQLVALTAFVADNANAGPRIAIVKLTNNADVEWAKEDLLTRLSPYIIDDPFIMNRLAVYDISSKDELSRIEGDIIIYLSHGGKNGVVIGNDLMTWPEMAEFVMKSDAPLHLFAACKSKEIIKFGDDNSGKHLYTVNGVRAAEITDVEITTVVLLALGFDQDYASAYRTNELLKEKDLLESGKSYHPLAFDDIILSEIDGIDTSYQDQYNSAPEVEDSLRYKKNSVTSSVVFSQIPADIQGLLPTYYPSFGTPTGTIDYIRNYYTQQQYYPDVDLWLDDIAETDVPTGCSYYGTFSGSTFSIVVSASGVPTASGAPEFELTSITLTEVEDGGIVVSKEKVDGVWQDSQVSRDQTRTGGSYVDTCSSVLSEQAWALPLDGWQYRKSHVIAGSAGAGTNYQVRLTVHYGQGTDSGENVYLNSHCQTDFGDIRFTADDEVTMLDYWMESYTAGNSAIFWVEVSDNLDYDTTIHIYYGNPSVDTTSNGAATFLFFDDFNDGSINAAKWNTYGTWSESGGTVKGTVVSYGGYYYHPSLSSDLTFNIQDTSLRARLKYNSLTTNRQWGLNTLSDTGGRCSYILRVGGAHLDADGGGYDLVNDFHPSWQNGVWYDFEMTHTVTGGTNNVFRVDSTSLSYTAKAVDSTQQRINLMFYVKNYNGYLQAGTTEMEFDWVYLRKEIANEPGHGAWSGEENLISSNDWSYRKAHVIIGSQGAGTGYQIQLNVHYGAGTDSGSDVYLGAKCETDFRDVRFASGDGVTLLDYWRESYTASDTAVFWVEVKSSLDSNRNIYIYYGNPSVDTTSNGAATFLFFDDFDDGSINMAKWNTHGTWSESGGTVKGTVVSYGNNYNYPSLSSDLTFNIQDTSLRARLKYNSLTTNRQWGLNTLSDTGGGCSYILRVGGAHLDTDGGSYDFLNDFHPSWQNGVWYDFEMTHTVTGGTNNVFRVDTTSVSYSGKAVGATPQQRINLMFYVKDFYGYLQAGTTEMEFDWVYLRKQIANEPSHGSWGAEEGSGIFQSNGDYLFVPSIAAASGWHGPVLTRTLPSAFTIEQMDTFSVDLSLFHAGIGDRESKTSVNLFDEYGHITFSLQIVDDTTATSQKMCVVYYGNAGGGDPTGTFQTGYISGDYTGTASIRYDPHRGLIAKVSGSNEVLFTASVDSNRLITSMKIESLRNGNHAEHDERIDNILVSYASSEYTVFHDPCSSVDAFSYDPNFSWGPPASGNLYSPAGFSYMYPTNIPTGSGWHGPNFVQHLDRPFRLYQLDEFSVIGEMVESTASQEGELDVWVFDDMGQPIFVMWWIDSSSGSQQCYFGMRYYPQGGSPVERTSSYSFATDTWTGKLWWDPWQGGNGAVYTSLDGSVDPYPWEVNDASRIISTIVIRAGMNSGYALNEMRIHDINIKAAVNAVAPGGGGSESVECDGTYPGSGESNSPSPESLETKVETWWTIPWPKFHTRINEVTDDNYQINLHVSTDILGAFAIEEPLSVDTDNPNDPVDQPGYYLTVEDVVLDVFNELFWLEQLLTAADIATTVFAFVAEKSLAYLAAAILACIAWTLLFAEYISLVIYEVCEKTEDPFVRFWSILILGVSITFGLGGLNDIVKDLGGALLASGMEGVTECLFEKPTGSLTFMLWKLICCLLVFVMAGAILTATLLYGLI